MTTARATTGSAAEAARTVSVGGQIRSALLVTSFVGVLTTVVGALVSGASGAAGAAIGAGMVVVFFGVGALVVNAVAAVSPPASLLVALLTYVLQVVLVGVVLAALDRSGVLDGGVDRGWAAGSVIAATLVWLVTHIISVTRSRIPLYDLPERVSEGHEADAR
jgi:ATP synthase protein I